jgi:hypothetical protein
MAAPGSLAEEDASLFYKLYQSFLAYSGQKTGVAPELRGRDDFLGLETEEKAKIRDASYKSGDLLGEFVESNPFNFASEEIELVKAWKDYVRGTFYVVRLTREGAIFLEEGKDAKSFLVLALGSPLEELLPFRPPVRVEAVLLPFKGRIVYDGLLRSYRLYIGGGMSRSIRAACDDAILKYGIITSLPYAQAERDCVITRFRVWPACQLAVRCQRSSHGCRDAAVGVVRPCCRASFFACPSFIAP